MSLFAALIFIILWIMLCAYLVFTLIAAIQGGAFMPSFSSTVRTIIRLADLKPGEVLIDLGSGDGRIVIAGARAQGRCIGYEINPFLLWYSRLRATLAGLRNASFKRDNFWSISLEEADVLTAYLWSHVMPRLKEKVLREMKPGSRVILSTFQFPDWPPDAIEGKVYLYRVPDRQ